jgi:hypothetical protein
MANNRMYLVCNVCLPPGTREWPQPGDPALLHIAKWYPASPWYSQHPESLGDRVEKFFEDHMHPEIHLAGEENPVRLEYETWVRDMPAIKKWEAPGIKQ